MFRGVVAVLLLAGLVSLACSSDDGDGPPGSSGEEESTRTASTDGIDVEATWLGSADQVDSDEISNYPIEGFVLIEVNMDTHSGDLGSIDMVKAAELRTAAAALKADAWLSVSDDAHHRSGVIVFPRQTIAGPITLAVGLPEGAAELVWEQVPGD